MQEELDISYFWYQALGAGLTEQEFWESNPRKIMLLLMYKGVENGALETKKAHQKKDDDNMLKLMNYVNGGK